MKFDYDYNSGGLTGDVFNMKPRLTANGGQGYDINADADNSIGKVDVKQVMESLQKSEWTQRLHVINVQQENQYSAATITPSVMMAQDTINKISDDTFKLDKHGDMFNFDSAAKIFGGDREQMHDYMYATSPEYKQRKDYWMKVDPPVIPTQGPAEGAVWAAALPGSFAGNSLKRAGKAVATGIAFNLMDK